MTSTVEGLAGLRGLHLPAEGPLSLSGQIGLVIAVGLLAALAIAAAVGFLARRRISVRLSALRMLEAARRLDAPERLLVQAKLLRRLARTLGGTAVARAKGKAWAEHLDRIFATTFFTAGAGRYFAGDLYRPGAEPDPEAIERELTTLIRRIKA
ncbi:DUF4381 domain-containing protein [Chelatococcus sp. GCM10030263]|uniref:DUF4381 domain-containing protein n=1 Tax=Chelatococcus sp. GCM10030263 TaxID=3273387 RepID=UPI003622A76C